MYIDESVLREYLEDPKKFEALCRQKQEIVGLWKKTIDWMSVLMEAKDPKNAGYYKYKEQNDDGRSVLNQMIKEYEREKQLFEAYAFVLGGVEFDDKNNARSADPKIMKLASGGEDFSNDVFASISKKNTYNLLTNNHPDNLVYFLKHINEEMEFDKRIKESGLVISHPWEVMGVSYGEGANNDWRNQPPKDFEKNNSGKISKRFPLKFLWMWANQDEVIHPLSLIAFREFLKSDFMLSIFKEKQKEFDLKGNIAECDKIITNSCFNDFQKIWRKVSQEIYSKLKDVCKQENFTYKIDKDNKIELDKKQQISFLISLLTLGETDMANIDELLKTHKQIILYGVPGTGKTHSAKELVGKWSGENIQDFSELKKWQFSEIVKEKYDLNCEEQDCEICQDINNSPIIWEIMQFHPNTTYQDFIGGITPKIDKETLLYELKDGKFKKFCEYANKYRTKEGGEDRPFVFIIDEINRANLSEVLGELLYALEYRDEGITIPNFDNKPFIIPSNVYIIGTMNNVDKSLSTFDLALRRRFGFYEIKPDLGALNKILSFEEKTSDQKQQDSEAEKPLISEIENYIARCENLNKKIIEKLGDKNAQIGQAYYGKIEHFLNKDIEDQVVTPFHLQKLWDYHLEPLLQEYVGFMDDGEKKVEYLKKVWLGKVEE